MSKIISIHSFRGGTGKSNTTANVTALLAASGMRVGGDRHRPPVARYSCALWRR